MVKLFEEYSELPEIPEEFKGKVDVNKFISNGDGTFTYNGNIDFSGMGLKKLPNLKITKVIGNFYCTNNQLTSLEGAPLEVGRNFICFDNKLTSLEFGPREVGGFFNCSENQLTSLEFAPERVICFYCYNNYLLSVKHESTITEDFDFTNSATWKGPQQPLQEIVQGAIKSISEMSYEQQIKQLNFFGRVDSRAYKLMMEILEELGVEVNQVRKDFYSDTQDKDKLRIW